MKVISLCFISYQLLNQNLFRHFCELDIDFLLQKYVAGISKKLQRLFPYFLSSIFNEEGPNKKCSLLTSYNIRLKCPILYPFQLIRVLKKGKRKIDLRAFESERRACGLIELSQPVLLGFQSQIANARGLMLGAINVSLHKKY